MSAGGVGGADSNAGRIRLLAREITSFTTRLLGPFDVTCSQADFLLHLANGASQPSRIAQLMGLDASNLSRMIRIFEDRAWIVRQVDEANRTRVRISLTAAGRRIASRIGPHAKVLDAAMHQHLTARETRQLADLLERVSTGLADGPKRPWP